MNTRMLIRIVSILLVCSWIFLSSGSANAQLLDAFRNLFSPSVPGAIERGLAPGGDLALEIQKLGSVSVTTMTEARAVVKAAKALPLPPEASKTKAYASALSNVLELFESVDGESIAAVHLQTKGIPELIRVYDTLAPKADDAMAEDLARLLRVLAMYYTTEGTDRVLDGVKRQLAEDSYWWDTAFALYDGEHPESVRFYREISDHLPSGHIGEALLHQANSRALEDNTFKHPFNNDAGIGRLKEWLVDDDIDLATRAVSAIEYIDKPRQAELFAIAATHPNKTVRLQTTYEQARLGDPQAFEQLAQYCLDVDTSKAAQEYLEQLDASDLIPDEAVEPSFAAKAELSAWLAYPDELGQAPDEMRIVDQRKLKWLDAEEPQLFTILEFVSKSPDPLFPETRGVGVVGSMTRYFFQEEVAGASPEDIYALHCASEASDRGLVEEIEEVPNEQQAVFLSQWTGEELKDVCFGGQWKFDPELGYPQDAVACASAKLGDEAGFVVFDGSRSHWYPAAEFPPHVYQWHICRIHVGRVLLGFALDVKREYMPVPEVEIPPEVIVREYQKWLHELEHGTVERQIELLTESTLLYLHFEEYADALVETQAVERDHVIKQTFEQFIESARKLPPRKQVAAFDNFSAIGDNFDVYVEAISDDPAKVEATLTELEPFWDHDYGRSRLARAAYHAGLHDVAQRLLEKQIELDASNRHRDIDSEILAEIWHKKGKTAEAKELLIGAIKQCLQEAMDGDYDREGARLDAQQHLDKYRQLFPDSAHAELEEAGVDAPIEELTETAEKARE